MRIFFACAISRANLLCSFLSHEFSYRAATREATATADTAPLRGPPTRTP